MEQPAVAKPKLEWLEAETTSGPTNHAPTTVRATYSRLLHELQFRATRNALMNYHEAERLQKKASKFTTVTNVVTAASASGLLMGIAQTGKVLASRAGLAGIVGLPICGLVQFMTNTTSELVPNYTEVAKKHIKAAAGWVGVAETARAERIRVNVDKTRDVNQIAAVYNDLLARRVSVSSHCLIPQETHLYFNEHPEMVCEAVKKRGDAYAHFVELEKTKMPPTDAEGKPADIIYF